jgi:transcriptional regulator with XRE-family HTH domain
VAEVKTYHADVERDGRFWAIRVQEVGRSTQARHVREIEPMARDLIVVMEDVPADSFRLEVNITLPDEVRKDLELSAELRRQAAVSQHAAAELTRNAARQLHQDGLTLRDIGKLLDVSHQRAHQLVEGGAEDNPTVRDLEKLLDVLRDIGKRVEVSRQRAHLVGEAEDRLAV